MSGEPDPRPAGPYHFGGIGSDRPRRHPRAMAASSATAAVPVPAQGPRLLVTERERTVVVDAQQLEWLAAAANYVELHLAGACYLYRGTLAGLERRLDPEQFLRVRRGAIVNVAAVAEIDRAGGTWRLVLRNGRRLAVARSRRRRVLAWLRGS
jgi:two-component system, LytTR family, response regulator